jgi:cob(I)alamin adenosyltransferase
MMDYEANMASFYLRPHLEIDHSVIEGLQPGDPAGKEKIQHGFNIAERAIEAGNYDIIILNGINRLLSSGVLTERDILELIETKPPQVELVLTGPDVPENVLEAADLVTEMVVSPSQKSLNGDETRGAHETIEVVTGNGKGKTTYCLGKAFLASSGGLRSTFLQFIKSPKLYGEVKAISKLPHLDIRTMGEGFLDPHSTRQGKKHSDAARRAWEECLREIFSLKYGLVVLDELNTATYYGLVNPDRVREMLFLKPHNLQLLVSGRNAHLEVRAVASTVIEMREIKHPFRKGIKARKGIEY